MKKVILISICTAILLSLSSCSLMRQTATQQDVKNYMASAVVGELKVSSEKITYTYHPTKAVSKLGEQNCINMAIHEALKAHGSGDILVETEEAVVFSQVGPGKHIKSVTVSGYPAKYVKFTPVDKQVVEDLILLKTADPNKIQAFPGLFSFLKRR